MATNALGILSLEDARNALDIPPEITERDAYVTGLIEQAVSIVSEISGFPLIDEVRPYKMTVVNEAFAAVELPFGWPPPTFISSFSYRISELESLRTAEYNDQPGFADLFSTFIVFDEQRQQWLIPALWWGTGYQWPQPLLDAVFNVKVGLNVNLNSSKRYISAVILALRALYENEPVPVDEISRLING